MNMKRISLYFFAILLMASCCKIRNRGAELSASAEYENYEPEFEPDPEIQDDRSFNTERYEEIVENDFKSAETDPISVFSVDVDNASYSNVRRFLSSNQMPAPGSVRIEEMINYFPYTYPQPSGVEPIAIHTELSRCDWNQDHELLKIGIKAKEVNVATMPSNNLVFLLDVSGSMYDENKLPLLVNSFKMLASQLRRNDYVSIVTYAGYDEVKLEPTACDSDGKEKIFKVLEGLSASGSTRGFNALEKAYDLAQEHFISGGNNRILLATDGDFNVGPSSDAALVELVEEKAKSGIFITVLGYGMYNLNDSMMEKISNAGNGNYFYIDNMSEAKKALGTGLWGNLFVVAKDVKVLVDFNPNIVKSYRLIGYENRMLANEDFDNDKKDAGDMGSGHTVTAIYELVTASSKKQIQNTSTKSEYTKSTSTGDTENYLTVKFRYKNPQDTVSQLVEKKVNKSTFTEKPSSDFILASSVASFGMLLRGSKYAGDATYDSVLEHLKDIPSDPNGYVNDLRTLVRKANDLDKKNGANKADDLNKEEEASAPQAVY